MGETWILILEKNPFPPKKMGTDWNEWDTTGCTIRKCAILGSQFPNKERGDCHFRYQNGGLRRYTAFPDKPKSMISLATPETTRTMRNPPMQ